MKKLYFLLPVFLFNACSSSSSPQKNTALDSGAAKSQVAIRNPYEDGSGHYAGYEWAERTGGSCSGNSESFNEGCEEYYSQVNANR